VNPFDVFDIQRVTNDRNPNGQALTEKQRGILLKQGIDPDAMTYANSKRMLDHIFKRWSDDLCSFKQAALLKRYGYEAGEMKRADAKRLIDRIAANGWKRPVDKPVAVMSEDLL
jgi:hypothetical protein